MVQTKKWTFRYELTGLVVIVEIVVINYIVAVYIVIVFIVQV